MTRSPRPAASRRVLAGVGALAAVAALAACDKPTPGVTIQSGGASTVIKAQTYCFDASTKACRVAASGNVGSLTVGGGDSILVDVPRKIAGSYWQVRSATQSSDGTFTSLTAAGTQSSIVHDKHSTRVQVPLGSGDYYLIVTEAAQGADKATGSWVARIVVTS